MTLWIIFIQILFHEYALYWSSENVTILTHSISASSSLSLSSSSLVRQPQWPWDTHTHNSSLPLHESYPRRGVPRARVDTPDILQWQPLCWQWRGASWQFWKWKGASWWPPTSVFPRAALYSSCERVWQCVCDRCPSELQLHLRSDPGGQSTVTEQLDLSETTQRDYSQHRWEEQSKNFILLDLSFFSFLPPSHTHSHTVGCTILLIVFMSVPLAILVLGKHRCCDQSYAAVMWVMWAHKHICICIIALYSLAGYVSFVSQLIKSTHTHT